MSFEYKSIDEIIDKYPVGHKFNRGDMVMAWRAALDYAAAKAAPVNSFDEWMRRYGHKYDYAPQAAEEAWEAATRAALHISSDANMVGCPTCGAACHIYSSDEGTNSFEPVTSYRAVREVK